MQEDERRFFTQSGILAVLAGYVVLLMMAAAAALTARIFLYLLVPALALSSYLLYTTVEDHRVSRRFMAATAACVAGMSLTVFQPYQSTIAVFDPAYVYTAQFVFIALFVLFLGAALYLERGTDGGERRMVLPYLVLVLSVAASIALTQRTWVQTLPPGARTVAVGTGPVLNMCSSDASLSVVCRVCSPLRLGAVTTPGCYYTALGVIGTGIAGLVTGHLHARGMDWYKHVPVTVLTPSIGVGLVLVLL